MYCVRFTRVKVTKRKDFLKYSLQWSGLNFVNKFLSLVTFELDVLEKINSTFKTYYCVLTKYIFVF